MQQDTARLWQLALKNAIAEADPRLAQTKIETAEVAIFLRIHSFAIGRNAREDQALFDALITIRGLKARASAGLRVSQEKEHTYVSEADSVKNCPV